MKRYLFFAISLFMLITLTGCHDDEPVIPDEDEVVEKEPFPTYDIIETTIDAKTVVCAEGLDEISILFRNRLINENIQQDITPETELVIIDEKSAPQFINDKKKYQQLEDLYLRGGLIYFHKPALQCSALVARIQLGVFNEIPDESIPPLYDVYILNIKGSEYKVDNVYRGESKESTYFDEYGNPHTETVENIEEPSEYLYGRYAENAAKFVNMILHGEGSASRTNVRSLSMPDVIKQCDNTIYLSQTYKKKDHHMAKDVTLKATGVISIIAKIECDYDSKRDIDNYHITLTESYPGSLLWLGEKKIHYTGAWYDKYGGFALSAFNVKASLTNPANYVVLESHNITNKHNNEREGLKHGVSVKEPFDLYWSFSVKNPLKYSSRRAKNGTVNDYSKIFTSDFSVEESCHWSVSNSSNQQDQDMVLVVNSEFSITSGAASSGIGANHDYNVCNSYNFQNDFKLPVPDKYEDRISLTFWFRSGKADADAIEKVLFANSPTLKSLYYERNRTAQSRKRLIHLLSKEWQKVYDELKNANLTLPGQDAEVYMTLRTNDSEYIHIGENEFTKICINKDGEVSME